MSRTQEYTKQKLFDMAHPLFAYRAMQGCMQNQHTIAWLDQY